MKRKSQEVEQEVIDEDEEGSSSEVDDEELEDEEEDIDDDSCEEDDDLDEEEQSDNQLDEKQLKKVQQSLAFESPDAISTLNEEEDEEGSSNKKKRKEERPKLFKAAFNKSKRLIVVLERANLELIKVTNKKTQFELINCDDHINLIRKYKKDPAFCRPDILHQCLLMLFDSPLNRAGLLQVYVHTINNILIEINPQTRFPRTFKRFANLMVQLLYKMSIKSASSASGSTKLLKVIKNPITAHLPVGCRKIGTSFQSKELIKPIDLVPKDETSGAFKEEPLVVVIGAMAHGQTGADYVEREVSISQYPLSGALACAKIVGAFEEAWSIH